MKRADCIQKSHSKLWATGLMKQIQILLIVSFIFCLFCLVSADNERPQRIYNSEIDTLLVLQKGEEPLKIVTNEDRSKFALAIKNKKKKYILYDNLEKSRDYDAILNLNTSPDRSRFAFTAKLGRDYWLVVDGKEMGPFNSILSDTVVFSPDSKRFAFAAGYKFSSKTEEYSMMVDGYQNEKCDAISLEPPRFSKDSKRLIYFAVDDGACFAIVDGEEGPKFENTGGTPSYSFDGQLVSYYGIRRDRAYMVVNDTLIGGYYGVSNPIYSPNFLEIAYAVWKEKKSPWQVYINFKPVEKYLSTNHPVYSPDGSRFGFWASDGEMQFAVVDWVEDPSFDSISNVRFTRDSKHYYYLAYISMKPKRWVFVVDGKQLSEMTGKLERSNLFFSKNTSKVAYLWQVDKNTERLVVEDTEFNAYNFDDVIFSPDENRYAVLYKDKKSSKWQLLLDGERKAYGDYIAPNVTFSPDSKDIAFFSWHNKKVSLVINDQIFDEFEYVFPLEAEYNSDGTFVYYAIRDNYLFKVTAYPK